MTAANSLCVVSENGDFPVGADGCGFDRVDIGGTVDASVDRYPLFLYFGGSGIWYAIRAVFGGM
jgi:hypothetical protein